MNEKNVINISIVSLFVCSFLIFASVSEIIGSSDSRSYIDDEIAKIGVPTNRKQKIKFLEELAQEYTRSGKYDFATLVYEKLLNLRARKSRRIEYYVNLGDIYSLQKKYTLGIESYQNALSLRKKNIDITLKIGNMFLKNNLYDFAKRYFVSALAIDKNSNVAKIGLGDVFFSQDIYMKAVYYYDQVPPEIYDEQTVMKVAKCYRNLNRLDNAISILETFMAAKSGNSDMVFFQALLYIDKKEYIKAKDLFLDLIKNGVEDFKVYMYLASLYDLMGENLKAKEMFDRSHKLNPSCFIADFMRAKISYKMGKFHEAREFAASAYKNTRTTFTKRQTQKLVDFLNK